MLVFYFFAVVVICLGVLSLRGGLDFAAYVRREIARPLPDYAPYASVIVPCRGLEEGLRENLAALFQQAFPNYELLVVTDRADDESVPVIEEILKSEGSGGGRVSARLVIAGETVDCGQKVHNLRTAVVQVDPRCEVLVFVDSDARPHSDWLRSLVAPLANEHLGAATGYRWFISEPGFASQLRSVWNASIASALGEREDKNFCWGGSTAIRRATFERLKVSERWRGTVSDDFTLTTVLQEAKLAIHFVPACLVASFGHCSANELLEFTNRQLKITRVYAAHLWKPVLVGSLLFCTVFFGGLALVMTRAFLQLPFMFSLALLLLIYVLGAAKAYVRLQAIAVPMAGHRKKLVRSLPAHLILWPLASALYLCNAAAAAFSRRISWRGITYELKSATDAVIISPES